MSLYKPELEIVDKSLGSVRYLEHGWPTDLCRWHSHEEYELHLLLATRGKTFIGDYIGDFEPGSFYLIGPRLPHNWVTYDESEPVGLRDMLIQFDHLSLTQASNVYTELKEILPLLEQSQGGVEFVGFAKERAKEQLATIRDSKGLKRLLLSLEFLAELSSWKDRRILSMQQMAKTSVSKHEQISAVVDYIMLNYTNKISLQTAADIVGMTKSAFSRYFQKITGNRFSDFVKDVRISNACNLLMTTDELVVTIGSKVGFNNLANFNRQFLELKGMAPSDYRRIMRDRLSASQRGEEQDESSVA